MTRKIESAPPEELEPQALDAAVGGAGLIPCIKSPKAGDLEPCLKSPSYIPCIKSPRGAVTGG